MFDWTYYNDLLNVNTKEEWCENVILLGQKKMWKQLWVSGLLLKETGEKKIQYSFQGLVTVSFWVKLSNTIFGHGLHWILI